MNIEARCAAGTKVRDAARVHLPRCLYNTVARCLLPVRVQAGAGGRGSRPVVCFVTQFPFTSVAYHVSLAYKSC
jgi:hypothetical protein